LHSESSRQHPTIGVWTHWLFSQVSVVQTSLSLQSASLWQQFGTVVPEVQAPPWQVSPAVHTSPSSQGVPSGASTVSQSPVPGLHTLALHGSAG
jgi:hypothetical protein